MRVAWNQFFTREGPTRPRPGEAGAVCSLSASFTSTLEARRITPTSKPLLSGKQFTQLHAEELAGGVGACVLAMLGADEARDPV